MMYKNVEVNTLKGWYKNPEGTNIIDYLEANFLTSGWVIDKKVSPPLLLHEYAYFYPAVKDAIGYSSATYKHMRTQPMAFFHRAFYKIGSWKILNYANAALDDNGRGSYVVARSWLLGKSATYTISGVYGGTRTFYLMADTSVYSTSIETLVTGAVPVTITKTISSDVFRGTIANITSIKVTPAEGHPELLSTFSTELYVHTTTTTGEILYFSISLDTDRSYVKFFANTGFNTSLPVWDQPGTIKADDNNSYDYMKILVDSVFFFNSKNLVFIGDTDHFFFYFSEQNLGASYSEVSSLKTRYVYGGVLRKFLNFTGGQFIHGSETERYVVNTATYLASTSTFYLNYNNNWYGSTVESSVSNDQGYMDLVTPSNYTTAGYNQYSGELFVTQFVAGINLTAVTNAEYKPLGTVHNLFKHYGVTPAQFMNFKINGEDYYSFPKDTNNRIALRVTGV